MKPGALTALLLMVSLTALVEAAPAPSPVGHWLGTLAVGAVKLRLAFHIAQRDGVLSSTVDSLDQGARDLPVAVTRYDAPTLRLELPKLGATFVGKLEGDRLRGTWSQTTALPLELARVDKLAAPRRPQEPRRPFPYTEEEVTIPARAAPLDPKRGGELIALAGTLTLPPGPGPFPCAVFVTGLGPQDRDETVFDHRPFLVLSDALTRRGVATLRVDDRGVGKSTGSREDKTTLDFVEDLLAQVTWLANRKEIDRRAIGVIGHSEGGLVGPIAATKNAAVKFLVMLAGTAMDGEKISSAQNALIAKAGGASDEAIAHDRAETTRLFSALRVAKSDAEVEAAVRAFIDADPSKRNEREGARQLLRAPWLRTFLTLDPIPYLERVKVPVLSLAGDLDLQVPKDNTPLIARALERGGNRDATVRLLPGLNHLFQHTKTGAPSEYGSNEETFAPEAMDLVTGWVVERAARLRRVR